MFGAAWVGEAMQVESCGEQPVGGGTEAPKLLEDSNASGDPSNCSGQDDSSSAQTQQGAAPLRIDALGEGAGLPSPWISSLLTSTFFGPCELHRHLKKNECTYFCTTCAGQPQALCQHCMADHCHHRVIQVRRYVYCDVVRVADINQYVEVDAIQAYIINQAKVVFLNPRPASKVGPPGAPDCCRGCSRTLREGSSFCSLACKVQAVQLPLCDELCQSPGSALSPARCSHAAAAKAGAGAVGGAAPRQDLARAGSSGSDCSTGFGLAVGGGGMPGAKRGLGGRPGAAQGKQQQRRKVTSASADGGKLGGSQGGWWVEAGAQLEGSSSFEPGEEQEDSYCGSEEPYCLPPVVPPGSRERYDVLSPLQPTAADAKRRRSGVGTAGARPAARGPTLQFFKSGGPAVLLLQQLLLATCPDGRQPAPAAGHAPGRPGSAHVSRRKQETPQRSRD